MNLEAEPNLKTDEYRLGKQKIQFHQISQHCEGICISVFNHKSIQILELFHVLTRDKCFTLIYIYIYIYTHMFMI